jgi:hypothetical protein
LRNFSAVSWNLPRSTAALITPLRLRPSYASDRCLIFKDEIERKDTTWVSWLLISVGTSLWGRTVPHAPASHVGARAARFVLAGTRRAASRFLGKVKHFLGKKGFLGKAQALGFDPHLFFDPIVKAMTQKSLGRSRLSAQSNFYPKGVKSGPCRTMAAPTVGTLAGGNILPAIPASGDYSLDENSVSRRRALRPSRGTSRRPQRCFARHSLTEVHDA